MLAKWNIGLHVARFPSKARKYDVVVILFADSSYTYKVSLFAHYSYTYKISLNVG